MNNREETDKRMVQRILLQAFKDMDARGDMKMTMHIRTADGCKRDAATFGAAMRDPDAVQLFLHDRLVMVREPKGSWTSAED